jgi:putative NIF3 family GTP cyclohydrolase 1 type 2
MDTVDFLNKLKLNFSCGIIRHTELVKKRIKKVAFCGGSGFFLLKNAIQSGADIFITGDVKYHEFFDADGSIILADIGHYESEQFTSDLIDGQLKEKFTTFAVHLTENNTSPINYL